MENIDTRRNYTRRDFLKIFFLLLKTMPFLSFLEACKTDKSSVEVLRSPEYVRKKVIEFWHSKLPREEAELMCAIAECESKFNQYEKDGTVYVGRMNPDVFGVMQINKIWLEELRRVEKINYDPYDITTLQGNLDMAWFIYRQRRYYKKTGRYRTGPEHWTAYQRAKQLIAQGRSYG